MLGTGLAASAECRVDNASVAKSTAFFEVTSANQVTVREGVDFEVVRVADREILRFSQDKLVVATIECNCGTGCSGDCSISGSGNERRCTGGCYNGTEPCVSCTFRDVAPETDR
jgi:hypothetical protein